MAGFGQIDREPLKSTCRGGRAPGGDGLEGTGPHPQRGGLLAAGNEPTRTLVGCEALGRLDVPRNSERPRQTALCARGRPGQNPSLQPGPFLALVGVCTATSSPTVSAPTVPCARGCLPDRRVGHSGRVDRSLRSWVSEVTTKLRFDQRRPFLALVGVWPDGRRHHRG